MEDTHKFTSNVTDPKSIEVIQAIILGELNDLVSLITDFNGLQGSILLLEQKKHQVGRVDTTKGEKPRPLMGFDSVKIIQDRVQSEIVKIQRLELTLVFIGTMNAGKSMAINAIIGSKVLPSRNTAMTTLPTILTHKPGQSVPLLNFRNPKLFNSMIAEIQKELVRREKSQAYETSHPDKIDLLEKIRQGSLTINDQYQGEDSISETLTRVNDIVRLCFELRLGFLWDAIDYINDFPSVEVEFASLKDSASISQGNLCLIDSPGPNEPILGATMRDIVSKLLREASVVVNVLDYTGLNTEAEKALRGSIQQVQELAGTNLFVLLNKFDQRTADSISEQEAIDYVCTEIHPQRNLKGKIIEGLPIDRVFPISAKKAFFASFARRVLSESNKLPSEDWVEDWGSLAYGVSWRRNRHNQVEAYLEACDDLYEDSGLNNPLEKIIVYSFSRVIPLCFETSLESMQEVIQSLTIPLELVQASSSRQEGAALQDATRLEHRLKDVKKAVTGMKEIEQRFFGVGDDVEKELAKWEQEAISKSAQRWLSGITWSKKLSAENSFEAMRIEGLGTMYNAMLYVIFNPTVQNQGLLVNVLELAQIGLKFKTRDQAEDFVTQLLAQIREEIRFLTQDQIDKIKKMIGERQVNLTNYIDTVIRPLITAEERLLSKDYEIDIRFPPLPEILNIEIDYETIKNRLISREVRVSKRHWYTLWLWEHPLEKAEEHFNVHPGRFKYVLQDNLEEIRKMLTEKVQVYVGNNKTYIQSSLNDILAAMTQIKANIETGISIQEEGKELEPKIGSLIKEFKRLSGEVGGTLF